MIELNKILPNMFRLVNNSIIQFNTMNVIIPSTESDKVVVITSIMEVWSEQVRERWKTVELPKNETI